MSHYMMHIINGWLSITACFPLCVTVKDQSADLNVFDQQQFFHLYFHWLTVQKLQLSNQVKPKVLTLDIQHVVPTRLQTFNPITTPFHSQSNEMSAIFEQNIWSVYSE